MSEKLTQEERNEAADLLDKAIKEFEAMPPEAQAARNLRNVFTYDLHIAITDVLKKYKGQVPREILEHIFTTYEALAKEIWVKLAPLI